MSQEEDKPLTTSEPVGPDYPLEPDMRKPVSPMLYLGRGLADLVRKPAQWIHDNVVERNRGPKYYWYHRKFDRVVPIDECYLDDFGCVMEAEIEFRRLFKVDRAVLELLKWRRDYCLMWFSSDTGYFRPSEKCTEISNIYDREEDNFFIKYGEMNYKSTVVDAYYKQKHRMILERRKAQLEAEREAQAQ